MLCGHAEHVWVEDLAVQEVMQEGMTGSVFLKMVVLGLQVVLCDIHVHRNNKDTESLIFSSAAWGNTTKIIFASKNSLFICLAISNFLFIA